MATDPPSDQNHEEQQADASAKRRSSSRSGSNFGKILLFLILLAVVVLPFTPLLRKVKRGVMDIVRESKSQPEPEVVVKVKEVLVPEQLPEPEPLPSSFVRYRRVDTQKLWSEVSVTAGVEAEQGGRASDTRAERGSYEIAYQIKLTIPKPITTVEEFASLNPDLPKMLPDFAKMLEGAKVSGFYHKLYELKQKRVQQNVLQLNRILSRHHMFDCETVLELIHPESKEKALLIQGEMDVVSDGSDGDRMPEFDEEIATSDNYQPFTSYYWRKTTDNPNPMLPKWEQRLKDALAAAGRDGLSASQARAAKDLVAQRKNEVARMKSQSWLIARADPFIVIPLSLHAYGSSYDFGPRIGDYAVVIHGDKLLPAIVGDAGPSWLTGEASLRIAKQLNEKANPYNRPESDLEVTYLIFPKTREWPGSQPDYAKWREKCAGFLGKLGGIGEGYELHEWEDVLGGEATSE